MNVIRVLPRDYLHSYPQKDCVLNFKHGENEKEATITTSENLKKQKTVRACLFLIQEIYYHFKNLEDLWQWTKQKKKEREKERKTPELLLPEMVTV